MVVLTTSLLFGLNPQQLQPTPQSESLVARLNSNLGAVLVEEGKTREASRLLKRALSLSVSTEGQTSDYAATLGDVAPLEAHNRHHVRAASMY